MYNVQCTMYNVQCTMYNVQTHKHILILYIYTCLHDVYTQKHIYMMSQVNNDILTDIIHVY